MLTYNHFCPCCTTLAPLGLWPSTGRAPCCPWAVSWSGCWSGAHHGRDVRARWGQAKTQLFRAAGGCARLGQTRSSGTGASRGHSDTTAHPPDRALRWGTGPPPKPCGCDRPALGTSQPSSPCRQSVSRTDLQVGNGQGWSFGK